MSWTVLWFSCLGFTSLAAGMSKHQRECFGKVLNISTTRLLRMIGSGILLACFTLCVMTWGPTVGISRGFFLVTFAALAVMGVLSYHPRQLMKYAASIVVLLMMSVILL